MSDNYKIFTDSISDLSIELVKELEITVLPLKYQIDGKSYLDVPCGDASSSEFYRLLRNGHMSTTSQVNVAEFSEYFEQEISKGTDILYIAASSGISGTYASSLIAAEDLRKKYPQANVICVDSLCASMGEGLLVYLACAAKKDGKTIEQNREYIEMMKHKISHWFTVDDLMFLKRGGRVSSASAFLGGLIGIKPILHVDEGGFLKPVSKVRGRKQSIDALFEKMKETKSELNESGVVFISHADCLDDAKYLSEKIDGEFHPEKIILGNIGPVVGSHSGPGTLALFFVGDKR